MNERELRLKLSQLANELALRLPEVQMLLCQERFLARLGSLPEGQLFIWKGGSLIARLYRTTEIPRYTIDVDLSVGGLPFSNVTAILEKAMGVDLNDGFVFTSITSQPMEGDLPYGGDRFELDWGFFSKQSPRRLKIDACAGDVVEPDTTTTSEAFILPFASENIELKVYPKEFILAEKLETMLRFSTGNTRCKDFIDIWMLIQSGIVPASLRRAIELCFANRRTELSLKTVKEILTDALFIDRLEKYRRRHFANLATPDMRNIAVDILRMIEGLFR